MLFNPQSLATFVNHLQALLNEFQLLSLYEEFQSAARLEKSIKSKAAELIKLNQGDYLRQELSVEMTGSLIEIQLDRKLVFKSNQGFVQRPDDLSKLENFERQLQGTISFLQQVISTQRQQEEARIESARLEAQREEAKRTTINPQEKGHGHGLAR